MNLLIGNNSLNVTNIGQKRYSHKSTKGDNKKNLWNFPKRNLQYYGFKYRNQEDFDLTDKNFDDYFSNYKCVIFFRTNAFIKRYYKNLQNNKKFKKILYIDDMHTSPEIKELKDLNPNFYNIFDLILSSYEYTFYKFFPECKIPVYWFPHSFNNIFKTIKYNNEPKNELLLSGAISKTIYPMRYKLSLLRDKYNITILEHPGYNKRSKHNKIGLRYYQYVNQFKFGFTCCSCEDLPYLVAKFFEIPACGACLIAYDKFIKEPMKKLGFIDGENYISIDENNLENKLEWIFDINNNNEIEKIRKNGWNLIRNKHMLNHRVDNLVVYLKENNFIK